MFVENCHLHIFRQLQGRLGVCFFRRDASRDSSITIEIQAICLNLISLGNHHFLWIDLTTEIRSFQAKFSEVRGYYESNEVSSEVKSRS